MSLVDRLLSTLAPRTTRRRAPLRSGACPPVARHAGASWRQRLGAWFTTGLGESGHPTAPPSWSALPEKNGALDAARKAFLAALHDIAALQAGPCVDQIGLARSLHELWHLRSQVFSLVSCHHSQGEANRRLALLDQHFSTGRRRKGAGNPASNA